MNRRDFMLGVAAILPAAVAAKIGARQPRPTPTPITTITVDEWPDVPLLRQLGSMTEREFFMIDTELVEVLDADPITRTLRVMRGRA